jgi:hypothetical protein
MGALVDNEWCERGSKRREQDIDILEQRLARIRQPEETTQPFAL